VKVQSDEMVTVTSSRTWVDHFHSANRLLSRNPQLVGYTYQDFLTLGCSKDYTMREGFFGPVNTRDGFMNSWSFLSTLTPPTYPWPDQYNTQTWWVKTPTSLLRSVLRQGPAEQKQLRILGIECLTERSYAVKVPEIGHWYGYLPEYSVCVDVSGHAISMLIAATYGVVDIRKYWDTVTAVAAEHEKTGKKSAEYKRLARIGRLTEDASVKPFKLWHTTWDYWAAVYTYILGAKVLNYPLDIHVLRISYQKIREMERKVPSLKFAVRKELRRKVLPLRGAFKVERSL
jgi:hypothetical protein